MRHEELTDLLMAHGDALGRRDEDAAALISQHLELKPEEQALFALASQLYTVLQPLTAPWPFRAHLREGLLAEGAVTMREPDRGVVWLAAAIGSFISVTGLIVFWRRRRAQPAVSARPAQPAMQ